MDIKSAIRPVFFQNDFEEWQYSTHGGTLFLVGFRGRVYGLTCKHVFGDFDAGKLFVARDPEPRKGGAPASVKGIVLVPGDEEISDLAVIIFADDLDQNLFNGTEFVINERTTGTSDTAHRLSVRPESC